MARSPTAFRRSRSAELTRILPRSRALQHPLTMFERKKKKSGSVDGGEGRGVPLGEQDELPPTGDRELDDDREELTDRDFGWEEGDPADRRRDPLRKP